MQQHSYLDHPTEDALEHFLFRRSESEELEVVETHLMACESCVARLEALETQIAVTKMALQPLEGGRNLEQPADFGRSWKDWFTLPRLSWAAAAGALVLGIAFIPQFRHPITQPAEVSLSAYRGSQTSVVPLDRALHVRLNAADLAERPVKVQIVDSAGSEVWQGTAAIRHDEVAVNVPGISEAGPHFLRLYAADRGNAQGRLLREFAFQAK